MSSAPFHLPAGRILVCGGRDYADRRFLDFILDSIDPRPSVLIHGAARGADRLAEQWATTRGVAVSRHQANWNAHGPSAGHIRNRQMLATAPDYVIAFPGGPGTDGMVSQARRKPIPVFVVAHSIGWWL